MYLLLFCTCTSVTCACTLQVCLFQLPEVHPQAKLLIPPPPIMLTEENWPLLTVAKGAFDTLGKDTGLATAAALLDEGGDEGWGDDELEIDECKFDM